MKQTLEEAAKEAIHAHYNCNGKYPCGERDYCEHCNGHNTAHDCCECGADEFKEGFIAGAEWHANQSLWISVEDRLPEENQEYLVVLDNRAVYVALYNKNNKSWLIYGTGYTYKVVAYMPIPSFDEIMEANRDVLERIKEKGD